MWRNYRWILYSEFDFYLIGASIIIRTYWLNEWLCRRVRKCLRDSVIWLRSKRTCSLYKLIYDSFRRMQIFIESVFNYWSVTCGRHHWPYCSCKKLYLLKIIPFGFSQSWISFSILPGSCKFRRTSENLQIFKLKHWHIIPAWFTDGFEYIDKWQLTFQDCLTLLLHSINLFCGYLHLCAGHN